MTTVKGISELFCCCHKQSWEKLEKAEHEREMALRQELIRQEKLEQLAARFDRKAAMREAWLSENQRLVAQVLLLYRNNHIFSACHCLSSKLICLTAFIAWKEAIECSFMTPDYCV